MLFELFILFLICKCNCAANVNINPTGTMDDNCFFVACKIWTYIFSKVGQTALGATYNFSQGVFEEYAITGSAVNDVNIELNGTGVTSLITMSTTATYTGSETAIFKVNQGSIVTTKLSFRLSSKTTYSFFIVSHVNGLIKFYSCCFNSTGTVYNAHVISTVGRFLFYDGKISNITLSDKFVVSCGYELYFNSSVINNVTTSNHMFSQSVVGDVLNKDININSTNITSLNCALLIVSGRAGETVIINKCIFENINSKNTGLMKIQSLIRVNVSASSFKTIRFLDICIYYIFFFF
jgi:hypothetical protein